MTASIRKQASSALVLAALVGLVPQATAQEAAPQPQSTDGGTSGAASDQETADQQARRNERLANYLSGVKFIGRFTVLDEQGRSGGEMPEEEYTIRKVEKLPQGDLFRFTARIRYGDTDTEVPMDLPVKWAGRTPIISLENLWIPGLGTFSARVVIHDGRYAGTWDHGPAGGHLFGRIVPIDEPESGDQQPQE